MMWDDKSPVTAFEVWQWPEFQAFAKKLGAIMDETLPTTGLIIDMSKLEETVKVSQIYMGSIKKESEPCI